MPINGSLPVPTTAALTPRLGLENPVDSDLFKSGDFAATFQILDAIPGTLPVANVAALQALTWTQAQHGTRVLELDNGAEWYWYQPSSSAGVWKRTNNVGLITYANSSNAVVTTATGTGPTFVTTPQFTAPGVRALRIDLRVNVANTSGLTSLVGIDILDNNTRIFTWAIRAGSQIGTGTGPTFTNQLLILNPTAGSTHQVSAQIRCVAVSAAVGGLGTSTCYNSSLTVTEI